MQIMEDLASTNCQVLIVLMAYLQCTGKKVSVILGLNNNQEIIKFLYHISHSVAFFQMTLDIAL